MKHLSEEQFLLIHDGTLPAGQEAEVRAHLAGCPACLEQLDQQEAARAAMAGASPAIPTQRMWQAIAGQLERPEAVPHPGWWERLKHSAWLSAGLAMAGFLGVGVVTVLVTHKVKQAAPVQVAAVEAVKPAVPAAQPAQENPPADQNSPEGASAQESAPAPAEAPQEEAKAEMGGPAADAGQASASSAPAPAPAAMAMAKKAIPEQRDFSTPILGAQDVSLGGESHTRFGYPYALPSPSANEAAAPADIPPARGGRYGDGSWNWAEVENAYNARNWPQTAAELMQAQKEASRPGERAFAASALHLLSQPGQPLAYLGLDDSQALTPESLVVLGAQSWSLDSQRQAAVFRGGVAVRGSGLRGEADLLVFDFRNSRALYDSPVHFTRVEDPQAGPVTDASGQTVEDNDIRSAEGAVYDFSSRATRLSNERSHNR
jgi:hypothetical protein